MKKVCEFPLCKKKAVRKFKAAQDIIFNLCVVHHARFYMNFQDVVFTRDKWTCRECGSPPPLNLHHINKKSQGGKDIIENCISLCVPCHKKAHNV